MNRLCLIRHAKSSWKDSSLTDFDRPLNKRGKKNAPFMAKVLKDKNIDFDLIISSPAVRAKQTALKFTEILKKDDILIYEDTLYDASLKDIIKTVKSIDKKHKTVAIFGHNPSLNMFCEYLCNCVIDNIPTCAMVMLELEKDWSEIEQNCANIEFFEYPKKFST